MRIGLLKGWRINKKKAEPKSSIILIAKRYNRGPEDWTQMSWTVRSNGAYSHYRKFRPWRNSPGMYIHGQGKIDPEDFELLRGAIGEEWSREKATGSGEEEWEFRVYDENLKLVKHREPGPVDGMEAFERMAGILRQNLGQKKELY